MNPIETRNRTTEEKIKELAEKLAAIPRGPSGRISGVTEELQEAVVANWRLSGQGKGQFATRVGISSTAMSNWVAASERRRSRPGRTRKDVPVPNPSAPTPAAKAFREVQVVEPVGPRRDRDDSRSRMFSLELGSGARVTGLSLSDIARLMRDTAGGGA